MILLRPMMARRRRRRRGGGSLSPRLALAMRMRRRTRRRIRRRLHGNQVAKRYVEAVPREEGVAVAAGVGAVGAARASPGPNRKVARGCSCCGVGRRECGA